MDQKNQVNVDPSLVINYLQNELSNKIGQEALMQAHITMLEQENAQLKQALDRLADEHEDEKPADKQDEKDNSKSPAKKQARKAT